MSEILILQSPLDFQREVIVHSKHHHAGLIVNVSLPEVIPDDSECENWNFSHVPTSSLHEVGIPDRHCKQSSCQGWSVGVVLESPQLIVIRLELRMELSIYLLPLQVIVQHFLEKIFVLRIVNNFSSSEVSAENIFVKSSGSEVLVEPSLEGIRFSNRHFLVIK